MEALLESSIAAKSAALQTYVEPEPTQKPPPASLGKEVSNLVINDAGEQNFIGKPAPNIMTLRILTALSIRCIIWPESVLTQGPCMDPN